MADIAYMRPSAKDNVVPCTQLRWHHHFGDSTSKEISDNAKKAKNKIKAVKYNTKMQKNGSRHAKKAKNTKGSKLADLAYMRPSTKDNVVPCTQLRWHHHFVGSTSKEISGNAKKQKMQ